MGSDIRLGSCLHAFCRIVLWSVSANVLEYVSFFLGGGARSVQLHIHRWAYLCLCIGYVPSQCASALLHLFAVRVVNPFEIG